MIVTAFPNNYNKNYKTYFNLNIAFIWWCSLRPTYLPFFVDNSYVQTIHDYPKKNAFEIIYIQSIISSNSRNSVFLFYLSIQFRHM